MESNRITISRANKLLDKSITTRELIFIICCIICVSSLVSPSIALLMGIGAAQFIGHPYPHLNHKATHWLLQIAVVGLGFGMNVKSALQAGREGFIFTVISILVTLILGSVAGKLLRINSKTSFLISAGTAICGGSAIAAISPVIKAEEKQISVALGTVFLLNTVALFLFPFIGELVHLSPSQFGLWCAIAIHDTSSVVGAAGKFGNEALQIATTVKLARALWIIPVALGSSFIFKSEKVRIKLPWFIGLFIIGICLNTYVPVIHDFSPYIVLMSKCCMTLTLFLIGSGLSARTFATVGWRPLLQGIGLWIFISVTALITIMYLN